MGDPVLQPGDWSERAPGPLLRERVRAMLESAVAAVAEPDRADHDAAVMGSLLPMIDRYPDITTDAWQTLRGDVDARHRLTSRLRFLSRCSARPVEPEVGAASRWSTEQLEELRARLVERQAHQAGEVPVVSLDNAMLLVMASVHASGGDGELAQRFLSVVLDQIAAYERLSPVLAEGPAVLRHDESAKAALRAVLDRLGEGQGELRAWDAMPWPPSASDSGVPGGQAEIAHWLVAADSLLAWESLWKEAAYQLGDLMPAITVSPTSACAGTLLTLTGAGFGTVPGKVRFRTPPGKGKSDILKIGPSSYTDVDPTTWTDTKITVVVPQFASCGVFAVRIPTGSVVVNGKTFPTYKGVGPVTVAGTLPEITDFRADGVTGRLVTARGSLVKLTWSVCPDQADVTMTAVVDGSTLWTKSGLPNHGSDVLPVGGTKTTDYEVTLTAKNACGSTTSKVVITVHRKATIHLAGLEITQGTQFFWGGTSLKKTMNHVPLISGKPTLVRAYLASDQDPSFNNGDVEGAHVELRGYYEGGGELPGSPLSPINPGPFKGGMWGMDTDRRDLRRTAGFMIPKSWMLPGPSLRLQARVTLGSGSLDSIDPTNQTARLTGVRFASARPLDVVVVLVDFTGTCGPKWPNCNGTPAWSDVVKTLQAVKRIYPTDKLRIFLPEVGDRILKYKGDKGCGACGGFGCLLRDLSDIAKYYDNDDDMVWWGAVKVGVHGVGGCGSSTSPGAHGFAVSRVTAIETTWEEFGHAYGRDHSFEDGNYPKYGFTDSDSIGEYGVDVGRLMPWDAKTVNNHLYSPYTASDFMSYDPAPIWVSPYTYMGIMHSYFSKKATAGGLTTSVPGARMEHTREERLVVCGSLWPETGEVKLEPLFHAPIYGYELKGPESGYDLVLVDAEGRTLRREAIRRQDGQPDGDEVTAQRQLRISQSLLLDPATAALEVRRDNETFHRVERPRSRPSIENVALSRDDEQWVLRWENGRDEDRRLLHGVAVTYDDGERWQRIGRPSSRAHVLIDPRDLAGGDHCRFRVFTSDGFNTVHVDTEAFSMPVKPPLIVPLEPEDGATVAAGRLVRLEVEAICPRFGSLEGEYIRWESDIQGPLGTDRELWTELIEGEHVLTITAGPAAESTATRALRVNAVDPEG